MVYDGPCEVVASEEFHRGCPIEPEEFDALRNKNKKLRELDQHSQYSNSNFDFCDGFNCLLGDNNVVQQVEGYRATEGRATPLALGLEHLPSASGIRNPITAISTDVSPQQVQSRKKPGKQFFVTLSLEHKYSTCRQDLVESVDVFCPLLIYCVCLERSEVSTIVDYHLHAFFEFIDNVYIEDLRTWILSLYDGLRLDIQPCRSKKSTLKYISKEDTTPYFTCKLTDLHFNYRSHHWAMSTPKFRTNHPFVKEHRFCYKFLERLHGEVQEQKLPLFNPFRRVDYWHVNWSLEVIEWWNANIGQRKIRQKQLYLWGPTKMGKTTMIENLIGRSNAQFVFYPGVGHFFMQDFNADVHKMIVFEEFEITHYYSSYLKRLLEGRTYSYGVKCGSNLTIKFNGPIIILSNNYAINDAALEARLQVIHAPSPYWEGQKAVIPKEEADSSSSEDEIIEISETDSSMESASSGED